MSIYGHIPDMNGIDRRIPTHGVQQHYVALVEFQNQMSGLNTIFAVREASQIHADSLWKCMSSKHGNRGIFLREFSDRSAELHASCWQLIVCEYSSVIC